MAESKQNRYRRTPRGYGRSPATQTPHNALNRLASAIQAPETPTDSLSVPLHTATTTPSLTNTSRIPVPVTPHARRALQRRAAANTPGRGRRKSTRFLRETPMDILRNLGKALAPVTKPVSSSPQDEPDSPKVESDELESEPDFPRPRLSLPINEMTDEDDEDGSPEMQPPTFSLAFDEDDITSRSIEMPRRERTARDIATLSRASFGSARLSDRFGDTTRIEDPDEALDFTIGHEDADADGQIDTTEPVFDAGGETEDLRRFNLDFSFPTPEGTGVQPMENLAENEQDDFVLDAVTEGIDADPPSSLSDYGAEGIEIAAEEQSPHQTPSKIDIEEQVPEVRKKKQKLTRHGTPLPSLPSGIMKKLATRFARPSGGSKTRINKDTLLAIEQATDWFFEQASEDLSAYAKHSGRKTIDETDVAALMRRQRHIGKTTSVFALAQKHLPKELLQDIRLTQR